MSNNSVFIVPPSPPPTPAPPEASLSTQERLRLAKRRRAAQLKRWAQREREKNQPDVIQRQFSDTGSRPAKKKKRNQRTVDFVANVMLLESAARNDIEEVRRLLELSVSPDSTNEDGLTALHQCCIDDSEEMMKLLVDYGANPNATDTEKWTPLHAAATCGHLHLVKFLIDHGADLLAVNADGNMPYDLCEDDTTLSYIENEMAKRGVTQELIDDTRAETERRMLKDLQSAPSEYLEHRDKMGATPLHIAAANGYLSVVEFLLDNHVTTDSVDLDLWQPIHAAACWGHLEVVEMLAQNGANISAKTKNGETPFDICEDPEIKERLIQLKEQRVRLEQPKVRRSRSASTRTQSIRRTSLREKMNVTKKDVQEEKLYFIQSFDHTNAGDSGSKNQSDSPTSNEASSSPNNPVVDINDVELTLLPSYMQNQPSPKASPNVDQTPRSFVTSSSNPDVDDGDLVQPAVPPRRPPRTGSSPSVSHSGSLSDKINIHVSVTINAPNNTTQSPLAAGSTNQSGTTLSDLKKARSQSRNSSTLYSPDISSVVATPPLPAKSPAVLLANSKADSREIGKVDDASPEDTEEGQRNSSGSNSNNGIPKFSASTSEVVGPPPKKTGCCIIL